MPQPQFVAHAECLRIFSFAGRSFLRNDLTGEVARVPCERPRLRFDGHGFAFIAGRRESVWAKQFLCLHVLEATDSAPRRVVRAEGAGGPVLLDSSVGLTEHQRFNRIGIVSVKVGASFLAEKKFTQGVFAYNVEGAYMWWSLMSFWKALVPAGAMKTTYAGWRKNRWAAWGNFVCGAMGLPASHLRKATEYQCTAPSAEAAEGNYRPWRFASVSTHAAIALLTRWSAPGSAHDGRWEAGAPGALELLEAFIALLPVFEVPVFTEGGAEWKSPWCSDGRDAMILTCNAGSVSGLDALHAGTRQHRPNCHAVAQAVHFQNELGLLDLMHVTATGHPWFCKQLIWRVGTVLELQILGRDSPAVSDAIWTSSEAHGFGDDGDLLHHRERSTRLCQYARTGFQHMGLPGTLAVCMDSSRVGRRSRTLVAAMSTDGHAFWLPPQAWQMSHRQTRCML